MTEFTISDTTALIHASISVLAKFANCFVINPTVNVEIEAHTDNQGSKRENQNLSELLAATFARYFIDKGIDQQRVASQGMGELYPITDNNSEANRAINRRVELRIIK